MKKIVLLISVILLAVGGYLLWPREKVEVPLKEELVIKGSDTMVQLVANLVEAYSAKEPEAKISVTGGGSGTGIAALINGDADIANSSRPLKEEEKLKLQERGIDYFEIIVARDGLSIIVHPTNPIETLTLEQIAKIYRGEITNWKEVGGKDQEISLYGRQSVSGTYVYFRDNVVKGDYSLKMREMEGNKAIIEAVKVDKAGIGYVGLGYLLEEGKPISGVKALRVSQNPGEMGASPLDKEAIEKGEYPEILARPLYQFIAGLPEPDSLISRFIKFILSEEGRNIVIESGFLPPFPQDERHNQKILDLLVNSKSRK